MKVIEVPFKIELDKGEGRSKGLHVSNLIREIALASKILGDEYADSEPDPLRVGPGLAWEDWICKQHPEICYHPGELSVDGIAMSPDGVSSFDLHLPNGRVEVNRLHEFKFTWKSSRHDITEQWMWFSQMKSYCKALDTVYARLHVFFVNGDYSRGPGSGPQYRVWDIEFTPLEIEENWQMILRKRDQINGVKRQRPIRVK